MPRKRSAKYNYVSAIWILLWRNPSNGFLFTIPDTGPFDTRKEAIKYNIDHGNNDWIPVKYVLGG